MRIQNTPHNFINCSLCQVCPSSLCQVWYILKISLIFSHAFFCNVTNSHAFSLRNRKTFLYPIGDLEHIPNFTIHSLYHIWNIMNISWKSMHAFFCNISKEKINKQTRETSQQQWSHNMIAIGRSKNTSVTFNLIAIHLLQSSCRNSC